MKNFKLLLFITISFLSLIAYAQTNKKTLNYQAVILDSKAIDIPGSSITGQPLNKGNVCLRFSLLNATGAYSFSGTTVTYVPANNGAYAITVNDRVQFDYTY
jgi:hypothetical protein